MCAECIVQFYQINCGGDFLGMEQISLPKDIRSYICKRFMFRLLKFLILAAMSSFLIYFLNIKIMDRSHILVYTILLVGLGVLPFWISELPMKLLDSSWRGTVKAVDIKEETGTYTVSSRSCPYIKHTIILTVEKENGKIIKTKAKEYGTRRHKGFAVPHEGNIQFHMHDYQEGDIVYHFYGLSELFVIGKNRPMNVNCVVCGSENPRKACCCHHCGHTLLHTLFKDSISQSEGTSS